MSDGRLERLISLLERDLGILESLVARMDVVVRERPWPVESPFLYVVAVTLDHYYSAFEAMAERVVRAFEGPVERSERWHRDLLEAVSVELREIRPSLVHGKATVRLRRLLEFRHFMRHAYGVPLDPDKLSDLIDSLLELHPMLREQLEMFVTRLRA